MNPYQINPYGIPFNEMDGHQKWSVLWHNVQEGDTVQLRYHKPKNGKAGFRAKVTKKIMGMCGDTYLKVGKHTVYEDQTGELFLAKIHPR